MRRLMLAQRKHHHLVDANTTINTGVIVLLLLSLLASNVHAWLIISKSQSFSHFRIATTRRRLPPSSVGPVSRRKSFTALTSSFSSSQGEEEDDDDDATRGYQTKANGFSSFVSVWTKNTSNNDCENKNDNNDHHDRCIYLLGTDHISGAQLVGKVVRSVAPDAVFLELDALRFGDGGWRDVIHGRTMETKRILHLLQCSYRQQQRQRSRITTTTFFDAATQVLPNNLDELPEEFAQAVRAAQDVGSFVVLGDQDYEVTLKRLAQAMNTHEDLVEDQVMEQLNLGMLGGINNNNNKVIRTATTSQPYSDSTNNNNNNNNNRMMTIERESVRTFVAALQEKEPNTYEALVAERDLYMGHGLDNLNMFSSMVAVVGIAHLDGIEQYLESRGWKMVALQS